MKTFDIATAAEEVWRPGVVTRMLVSHASGSMQLTIFEQWCDSEHGAPMHTHVAEETLEVIAGRARFTLADDVIELGPGQGVIVPAGVIHSFVNAGEGVLHTRATLAEPIFEARYVDPPSDHRRWGPEQR